MKKAFTIIELLVVIGIISILMGILIGTFGGSTESARAAKCQANMHNLAMAVQSYGMRSGYYPRASTFENKDGDGNTEPVYGWLGSLTDPYEENEDARRTCFDNGAIWDDMKHDRGSYFCPGHQRYVKELKSKGKKLPDPLWSYAMSSYFNAGADSNKQRGYGVFRRADRYLLFAELPYAKMKVGTTDIQDGNLSGSALDPVLDYNGNEVIGFNHKDGKNAMGHVCFVDGHVEKLRAPAEKGNITELTKWLCRPVNVDASSGEVRDDFDIRFNGTTYEKDEKER